MRVFISYPRKDEPMVNELITHLKVLQRLKQITSWHDRQILPGSEWKEAIDTEMDSADIILLLLTKEFIASDYCMYEMERAMALHEADACCVMPVMLEPFSSWKEFPFAKLQIYPKDALPISKWEDPDEAYMDVVDAIKLAVESLERSAGPGGKPPMTPTIEPRAISDFLLYMCDREQQEDRITRTLKYPADPARPFVFLIHGHDDQDPFRFRERLWRSTLPMILFGSPEHGTADQLMLRLPEDFASAGEFSEMLWDNLGVVVTGKFGEEREIIVDALLRRERPVVFNCEIAADNWERAGRRTLDGLLSFWNDFPEFPPKRLFCCPIISYGLIAKPLADASLVRDTLRPFEAATIAYVTSDGRAIERANLRVLPELPSIFSIDVVAWLQHPQLFKGICAWHPDRSTFCRVYEAIEEIQQRVYHQAEEIPMRSLKPHLKQILEELLGGTHE